MAGVVLSESSEKPKKWLVDTCDCELDEDYEVVPTYNTAGAAGYAGLRYRF